MTFLALFTGREWFGERTIATGCVPPAFTHSTTRLLLAARTEMCTPELGHADAVALDHQLGVLAEATRTTSPWDAACAQYGDDR